MKASLLPLIPILAALAFIHWWRAARPALPRQLVAVTLVGMAVVGIVTIYQARPYLKISQEYPTAKRTLKEVKNYSSGPAALLSASSENRVWGGATSGMRPKVLRIRFLPVNAMAIQVPR